MTSTYSQAFLDQYIGYRLEATAIAFIIINTIFVGLRLLAQHIRPAGFGWDDVWTLSTWPVIMVECGICIFVVESNAIGYHIVAQELYRPDKIALWGKWNLYVIPSLYVVASTLPKFSILAFYLRIFPGKWVRRACWMTATMLALAMIINFFTVVFQCNPRAKAWDPSLPGHCNNIEAHFRYSALPNLFTDIVMLIIPIPTTLKLQCPRRTKVAIICTFLLGSLGLVTCLFRMITFFTTTSIPLGDGTTVSDSTWDGNLETIWIVVEPSVYLISACLLSCSALFNWLLNDTSFAKRTSTFFKSLVSRSKRSKSTSRSPSEALELGEKQDAGVYSQPVRFRSPHDISLLSTTHPGTSESATRLSELEDPSDHSKEVDRSEQGPKADSCDRSDVYETV